MKMCRNFFAALLLMLTMFPTAKGEKQVVFPESFRLQESDGSPLISVRESPNEIVATIYIEASYAATYSQLRSFYGDLFEDLDITQVSIIPEHFDAMSEFFSKKNTAFKSMDTTFDINKAKISFNFTKDYSIAQIREALLFPISLGTLDSRIVCYGTVIFDRCNQTIKRLPILNQFSTSIQEGQAVQYNHLVFLRNYAANLIITKDSFLSESFSSIVKHQYFDDGNCASLNRKWDKAACETVMLYSNNFSIREAVLSLTQKIYPPTALVENQDYFVFAGSRLNLKEINLALDFDAIIKQLNETFNLILSDESKNPLPLIHEAKITTNLRFILQPNVLFWEGTDLCLNLGSHLAGTSNIEFSPIFGTRSYVIPISYNISFSMRYNPLTEGLAVDSLTVKDLGFLETSGIGYEFAQSNKLNIEKFVISYLNSPNAKLIFDLKIREILKLAQLSGIGFNLIKQGL